MAGAKVIEAIGPSYHLGDKKAACQDSINCYLEKLEDGRLQMVGVPGETQIAALTFEGRGSRNVEGRWFVAVGPTLYEMVQNLITLAWSATIRGTLDTSSGFVGMAHNATQLAIVDGMNYYVLSLATNALVKITTAGWRGSNDVHELDGYFVFTAPASDQFYISAIDDGTTLDPLDFSSADSLPDAIVTHRVSHRQLWLFGSESAEIWVDSGDATFPFVRYESYTVEVGIVGPRAAINAADTLFWIGQNRNGRGVVFRATGNEPQRISTTAVEQALRGSIDLSLATMWTYQIEGHEFIGVNAPGLESTWVYDAAEQQWHEEAEYSAGWQPIRRRLHTWVNGEHYTLDDNGKVCRLDDDVYALNGRVLAYQRTWPHLVQDSMEPICFRGLELAMRTGHTVAGNVQLLISNDGGSSFFNASSRSLGATGQRMKKLRWLGLGTAYNRVFRLRVTDAVPFALYQAAVAT